LEDLLEDDERHVKTTYAIVILLETKSERKLLELFK